MDQKAIPVIARDGFAKLLGRPFCRGMCRDIAMKNFSRTDLHNHQYVESAERGRHDRGKVARYQGTGVIANKRPPALGRDSSWPGAQALWPILLHRSWRYQDAQLERQFIGYALLSPGRVVRRHLYTQTLNVPWQSWSSTA